MTMAAAPLAGVCRAAGLTIDTFEDYQPELVAHTMYDLPRSTPGSEREEKTG